MVVIHRCPEEREGPSPWPIKGGRVIAKGAKDTNEKGAW